MKKTTFNQSKHFSIYQSITGYYRLMWKIDIIIDDPAEEDYCNKDMAMDIFNEWINEHDEWQNYSLKFFDEEFNEINSKSIIAYDDDEAERIAREIFANDTMNTDNIEVYDWKDNFVNTIV